MSEGETRRTRIPTGHNRQRAEEQLSKKLIARRAAIPLLGMITSHWTRCFILNLLYHENFTGKEIDEFHRKRSIMRNPVNCLEAVL